MSSAAVSDRSAVIQEIKDATIGRGGYAEAWQSADGFMIEWWMPELACPVWTQHKHRTIESALDEALKRIRETLARAA